ncbi:MAG: ABC transporter ATP-binding protein [Bacteroidota bacterium]
MLELTNISHSYGKNKFALKNISFGVGENEMVCLLGESGSGKSTLLRVIAGFEQPSSGKISIHEKIICSDDTFLQPEERKTGIVFQDYSLFPHLSIEKNIGFGCRENKSQKIKELLLLIGLTEKAKNFPHELSGGQQQRVAIARSLAADPQVLLLDEPFSSLDDSVKTTVRGELKKLLRLAGKTTLVVTHDINDCMALADRVIVLKNGEIIQTGTTEELFRQPKTLYVARLFGKIQKVPSAFGKKENAFIRPGQVKICSGQEGSEAKVTNCVFIGGCYEITLIVENSEVLAWSDNKMEIGIFTRVKIDDSHLIFFHHE